MKYINELEVKNKGLEVVNSELREKNKELKEKNNELEIYLAMARGSDKYNEKLLYATQREKKEVENKLAEAEKQIKILQNTVNTLTKENEELKKNSQQSLALNTQTTNADLQEIVLNGLNFLTKAMQYNQNSLQRN